MGGSSSNNGKARGPAGAAIATRKTGAKKHEPSAPALDHWINDRLRMLYGPVLSEPIPDDLAQVIERHRRCKQPS